MSADFAFDALHRFPDVEGDNLSAHDATDLLLLDEAGDALAAAGDGEVAVIGDRYGALTLGAAARFGIRGIRVHQDGLVGEQALAHNAAGLEARSYENHALEPSLLEGARVVLLQLPRSLDELDDVARAVATWAAPDVVLYAGGRIKHMTTSMNEVLARSFARVDVTHARQKSRVLVASGRRADAAPPTLRTERHGGLVIAATGSVFAGTKLDIGTRVLLEVLDRAMPDARDAIDLGCGTGVLAAHLARTRPDLRVVATDESASAVTSARATMQANGVAERVEVVRDDGLSTRPDASVDLIVLNPPFHIGATVHTGVAERLFAEAGRVLRPGGELWTVFNSHLGYRRAIADAVGPTRLITHSAKFTVVAARKG
jgi:16S rRNA (guanine1207-N2)-methyltransferase